jgi:hypothetical protein
VNVRNRLARLERLTTIVNQTAETSMADWWASVHRWGDGLATSIDPGPSPVPRIGDDPADWRPTLAAGAALSRTSLADLRAGRYPAWLPEDCHPALVKILPDMVAVNALEAEHRGLSEDENWQLYQKKAPKGKSDA